MTSDNVDNSFFKLIKRIYGHVNEGYFNDRLDQFNYFSSNRLRTEAQNALTGGLNTMDNSIDDSRQLR